MYFDCLFGMLQKTFLMYILYDMANKRIKLSYTANLVIKWSAYTYFQ